jgi:hypothetical protein
MEQGSNKVPKSNTTPVVDAVGELQLTGNLIPQAWFRHIATEAGKPDMLAMYVLSEIIFWYKPTKTIDEATGEILETKKKFAADLLQKSYRELADQLHVSKMRIKRAVDNLIRLGLIRREIRNGVRYGKGFIANGVVYLEPIIARIKYISDPSNDASTKITTPPSQKSNPATHGKVSPNTSITSSNTSSPTLLSSKELNSLTPLSVDKGVDIDAEYNPDISGNSSVVANSATATSAEKEGQTTEWDYFREHFPEMSNDPGVLATEARERAKNEITLHTIMHTKNGETYSTYKPGRRPRKKYSWPEGWSSGRADDAIEAILDAQGESAHDLSRNDWGRWRWAINKIVQQRPDVTPWHFGMFVNFMEDENNFNDIRENIDKFIQWYDDVGMYMFEEESLGDPVEGEITVEGNLVEVSSPANA